MISTCVAFVMPGESFYPLNSNATTIKIRTLLQLHDYSWRKNSPRNNTENRSYLSLLYGIEGGEHACI